MAQYKVQAPDGSLHIIEGPSDATPAQIEAFANKTLGNLPVAKQADPSLLGEAYKGLQQYASQSRTALGGGSAESALAGLERGKAIDAERKSGVDLEKIKDLWNAGNYGSSALEYVKQAPYAIAGQIPQLATAAGGASLGARLGALGGLPGSLAGAGIGALAGQALSSYLPIAGSNIESQAAEQQKQGLPIDINRLAAYGTAVPQVGLEVISQRLLLGNKMLGKAFGFTEEQLAKKSVAELEKLAAEKLYATVGKGVLKGGLAEIPTEVTQTMLERAQAGLSITDAEARTAYGDTALQVGMIAPLGGYTRYRERGSAQQYQEKQAQAESAKKFQADQAAETARLQSPAYLEQLSTDYKAAVAEKKRLDEVATAAKEAAKSGDPSARATAAEALKAARKYEAETLTPLAKQHAPRSAEIQKLEETKRVAGMSPFDYMMEQSGVPTQEAQATAPPQEQQLYPGDEPVPKTPPPLPAHEAYAAQQMDRANQWDFGTNDESTYVKLLMEYPAMARELVKNKTAIPGLTRKQNSAVLGAMKLQLAEQDKAQTEHEERLKEAELSRQVTTVPGEPSWASAVQRETTTRRETRDEQARNATGVGDTDLDFLNDLTGEALGKGSGKVAVEPPAGVQPSSKAPAVLKRIEELTSQSEQAAKDAELSFRSGNPTVGRQHLQKKAQLDEALSNVTTDEYTPIAVKALTKQREDQQTQLTDLEKSIDDLVNGRYLNKLDMSVSTAVKTGPQFSTKELLVAKIQRVKKAYINSVLLEAATQRRALGKQNLTTDEALRAASDLDATLNEWISRGLAAPRHAALNETTGPQITQPAQMRGTKIVRGAETAPTRGTKAQPEVQPEILKPSSEWTPAERAAEAAKAKRGETKIPLYDRLGVPKGPARKDAKHEELSADDAILLKKMVVKIVEDGLTSGKTRDQIIQQIEALTKGGVSNTDIGRIHGYITERTTSAKTAAPDPRPIEERRFGAYRQAIEVLKEQLEGARKKLLVIPERGVREQPFMRTQFAAEEAAKTGAERGEGAATLGGELRRRREAAADKVSKALARPNVPEDIRAALDSALTALEQGRGSKDVTSAELTQQFTPGLIDAAEELATRILEGRVTFAGATAPKGIVKRVQELNNILEKLMAHYRTVKSEDAKDAASARIRHVTEMLNTLEAKQKREAAAAAPTTTGAAERELIGQINEALRGQGLTEEPAEQMSLFGPEAQQAPERLRKTLPAKIEEERGKKTTSFQELGEQRTRLKALEGQLPTAEEAAEQARGLRSVQDRLDRGIGFVRKTIENFANSPAVKTGRMLAQQASELTAKIKSEFAKIDAFQNRLTAHRKEVQKNLEITANKLSQFDWVNTAFGEVNSKFKTFKNPKGLYIPQAPTAPNEAATDAVKAQYEKELAQYKENSAFADEFNAFWIKEDAERTVYREYFNNQKQALLAEQSKLNSLLRPLSEGIAEDVRSQIDAKEKAIAELQKKKSGLSELRTQFDQLDTYSKDLAFLKKRLDKLLAKPSVITDLVASNELNSFLQEQRSYLYDAFHKAIETAKLDLTATRKAAAAPTIAATEARLKETNKELALVVADLEKDLALQQRHLVEYALGVGIAQEDLDRAMVGAEPNQKALSELLKEQPDAQDLVKRMGELREKIAAAQADIATAETEIATARATSEAEVGLREVLATVLADKSVVKIRKALAKMVKQLEDLGFEVNVERATVKLANKPDPVVQEQLATRVAELKRAEAAQASVKAERQAAVQRLKLGATQGFGLAGVRVTRNEAAQAAKQALQDRVDKSAEELEAARTERETAKGQRASALTKKITELEKKIAVAQEQLMKMGVLEVETLQDDKKGVIDRAGQLTVEITQTKKQLEAAKKAEKPKQVTGLTNKLAKLEKEAAGNKALIESIRADQVEATASAEAQDSTEAVQRHEKRLADIEHLNEQIATLEKELEDLGGLKRVSSKEGSITVATNVTSPEIVAVKKALGVLHFELDQLENPITRSRIRRPVVVSTNVGNTPLRGGAYESSEPRNIYRENVEAFQKAKPKPKETFEEGAARYNKAQEAAAVAEIAARIAKGKLPKGSVGAATPAELRQLRLDEAEQLVNRIADKHTKAEDAEGDVDDFEFSRGVVRNPSTKAEVEVELNKAFGENLFERPKESQVNRAIRVYQTVAEFIADNPTYRNKIPVDAKGLVKDSHAVLFAENLEKGEALGVMLHEVGVHIGFRNFFNVAQYNALVQTVKGWAARTDNSLESRIGKAALQRVQEAQTKASQVDDEILAYAVEEAVKAGVQPAGTVGSSALKNWFKMIVEAFNKALATLGFNPEKLTVGDLVNFAYGCANLEIRGTWQGTGAQIAFKEFDFKYMGTGEARKRVGEENENVGYHGWGTYTAESNRTAKSYYESEQRKLESKTVYQKRTKAEAMKAFNESLPTYKGLSEEQWSDDANNATDAWLDALLDARKKGLERPPEPTIHGLAPYEIDIITELLSRLGYNSSKSTDFLQDVKYIINNAIELEKLSPLDTKVYKIKFLESLDAKTIKQGVKDTFYDVPKASMLRTLRAAPEDHYLRMDEPLENQSKYVEKKFVAAIKTLSPDMRAKFSEAMGDVEGRSLSGRDIYDAVAYAFGDSMKKASVFLAEHGIPGARVLDAASRREGKGTYNYVDFQDKEAGSAVMGRNLEPIGPAEGILLSRAAAPTYAPNLKEAGELAERMVGRQKTTTQKIKANLAGLAFRTQFVDALAPLEKIAFGAMDALKGMQMMYYLRAYGQRNNYTSKAMSQGVPQLVEVKRADGRIERKFVSSEGATLKDVVDILTTVKGVSPDAANRLFTLYMSAIRAKRVGIDALNFSGNITEADLDAAMQQIKAAGLEEPFERARSKYNEYNENLLKFNIQTGYISKALGAELTAQKDYIPFYRVRNGNVELLIGKETPVRIGDLKSNPHLQELVGGEEPIFDFLTSSVQNTSMLMDAALRNMAVKNAMFELNEIKVNGENAVRISKGQGSKGTVGFFLEGEEHYAVVNTEETLGIPSDLLVRGLEGIPTMLPTAVRLMGIPARLLRRTIVASPVYMARQLFRDSLAATMTSGVDGMPVLNALRQIGKSHPLNKSGVTGGQVFTGTSEDMSRLLAEMQSGKSGWTQALSKLEAMSMEVDAAGRRAQYNSYIQQGLSEMEAEYMALDSMNFSKRGISPSMHYLSTLIPFFNAQIQGLDVLYKAFTGKMPMDEKLKIQEKLFARGAMLAGMTLAYAAAMQDDEGYKNATPEQKYGNWFVYVPGIKEAVRVPIPFELGYVFKAIPEAIVNIAMNKDGAEEAQKAFKQIALQIIPGGTSWAIPQAVKPLIEVGLGKSFYTGQDIETAKEQRLDPGMRYRDNTSEAAKFVGQMLNISPIKMEALINGYTGTMGLALLQALNFAMPATGPEAAFKRLSEQPVIGPLFQPTDAGGIINATYDRVEEINRAKASYEKLLAENQPAQAQAYLKEHITELSLASVAGSFSKQMGELTKYEAQIKASNRTPEKKREELDRIRQLKIKFATSVRAAFDRKELQAVPA